MKVTSQTLFKIAAMPEQAMAVALTFLAEQLEAHEAKGNANAMRQKRYRDRHGGVTVTQHKRKNDEDVTLSPRVEDIINLSSKEGLENPPSSPPLLPSHFEQFWTVYPERAGVQNRDAAEKAFAAACKRADPAVIIAAAERYAADLKSRGKIGTEFVKQARGWLNESLWQEFQSKPQATPAVPKQVAVIEGTEAWKAWERHRGKRPPTTDIRIPGKQIQRGWYFPTEYPPSPDKSEEAA